MAYVLMMMVIMMMVIMMMVIMMMVMRVPIFVGMAVAEPTHMNVRTRIMLRHRTDAAAMRMRHRRQLAGDVNHDQQDGGAAAKHQHMNSSALVYVPIVRRGNTRTRCPVVRSPDPPEIASAPHAG